MEFSTFDVESTVIKQDKNQKFICGGFFNKGVYYQYEKEYEMYKDIISKRPKLIYAHNLDYDIRFFIDYLKEDFKLNIVFQDNRILKVDVFENDKKIIEFRDSFSLSYVSLDSFTKSFSKNIKKDKFLKKDMFEISNRFEQNNLNKNSDLYKKFLMYCKHDVLSLYESLENYFIYYELKKPKLTISSISFKRLSKDIDLTIIKNDFLYDDIFRKCYAGARTEVFRQKIDNDLNYYDVNSEYPYAMTFSFPIGKIKRNYNTSEHYDFYIAKIKTEIPKIYLPPIFQKYKDKTMFPIGKIEGWYNNIDIEILNNLNIKYKILKKYVFENDERIFEKRTNKLYNDRINTEDETKKFIIKRDLNSSYGKLGEKKISHEIVNPLNISEFYDILQEKNICKNCENYTIKNGKVIDKKKCKNCNEKGRKITTYHNHLLHIETEREQNYTYTHIAGYITSYARRILYNYLQKAIEKESKIYYCDTDSIITDYEFKTGKQLGQLKLEHKIIKNSGYFAAPKLYTFINDKNERIIKAKGTKTITKCELCEKEINTLKCKYCKHLHHGITFNDIKNYVEKKQIIPITNIRVSKMKSILKNRMNSRECYKIQLNLNPNQSKRRFIKNNDSIPFNTKELKWR